MRKEKSIVDLFSEEPEEMSFNEELGHQISMIKMYLADIEAGENRTGNLQYHLNKIKELFKSKEAE